MFIEIAVGIITLAVGWLFKSNVESQKEIAVLKEKALAGEKTHQEFKDVTSKLEAVIKDLTIAIEILKNEKDD